MADVRIDEEKLMRAVGEMDGTRMVLQIAVDRAVSNANADSAWFRTQIYHSPDKGTVGDTQPRYAGDVMKGRSGYVGLLHPKNYAAMKDNHENNTMLKACR